MKVLGLDVSSSVVGISIIEDGDLAYYDYIDTKNKNKFTSLNVICDQYFEKFEKIKKDHDIDFIYIEESLKKFNIASSANTISILSKVNALASYACYSVFKKEPKYGMATSIRKKIGISVPRGENAKQIVLDMVVSKFVGFRIEYTHKGNIKQQCYDVSDATAVALYGYLSECKNN